MSAILHNNSLLRLLHKSYFKIITFQPNFLCSSSFKSKMEASPVKRCRHSIFKLNCKVQNLWEVKSHKRKRFLFKFSTTKIKASDILRNFFFMSTDKHVNYLGCFVDEALRKLEFSMGGSSTNTPTECIQKCFEAGYKYAGVQVYM